MSSKADSYWKGSQKLSFLGSNWWDTNPQPLTITAAILPLPLSPPGTTIVQTMMRTEEGGGAGLRGSCTDMVLCRSKRDWGRRARTWERHKWMYQLPFLQQL